MNAKKRRQRKNNKKRKPKLTKEYLETESEISNLLKKNQEESLIIKSNENNYVISAQDQIDFFLSLNNQTKELQLQSAKSLNDINENSSLQSISHEEQFKSSSPVAQSDAITMHPVSSYIQVENLSPTRKVKKEKIQYNDEQLCYYPSSSTKASNLPLFQRPDINSIEDGVLHDSIIIVKDKNLIRMVNRFNEEGKFDLISSTTYIKNQRTYTSSTNELYVTENVDKNFEPFNYTAPISDIQREILSSRKLLTLTINQLKFTEHNLQTEEHRLAKQLEETFTAYHDIIERNVIRKLKLELINLRDTLKYFMENSNGNENFEKIENCTKQIKFFRKQLHKEELNFKKLIENTLSHYWKLLKNQRKSQGYNYTDFKLIIQIEEVDIETDEEKWNKRFQTELNEILREQLEKFYKEKRLRKSKKGTDQIRKYPLRKPDFEEININIENNLKACLRGVGEPKIKLYKSKLDDHCKNLSKFKDYYLQIKFDQKFVGTTKHFRLNSNFCIEIDQSFGVYLQSCLPKNIKIEIFEKNKLTPPDKICKCYIPLQLTMDYSSGYVENIEFSSIDTEFQISGILKVTIYCETESEISNIENINIRNSVNYNNSKSQISKEVIKSWYENNLINPLNPDCISMFNNLIEKHSKSHNSADEDDNDETFILNEDLLVFCSKDEIENNPRFKMLRARYNKDMKYKNSKFIPVYENEIEEVDSEDKVLDVGNWMDPIDLLRHKGRKYIENVYAVILNHCMQLKIDDDNSNLLKSDIAPSWQAVFNTIRSIFGPSRPLNPTKMVQPTEKYGSRTENINIIINIARATGIPIRNFINPSVRRTSSVSAEIEKQTLKYGNVKPFVCVGFKDKKIRTMTAEGSNPTWNEQLILEINVTKDISKEDLIIQIFDEFIEDFFHEGNTTRSMEVYQRIHTNWLGEYRIPMKTIFDRQNIEGCFEINLPKLILGYSKPTIDINDDEDQISNILEISDSVFIWLYISIEPKFDVEIIDKYPLESLELKDIKVQIEEWCIQVKQLFPSRFLSPLVCIENGERICMTRLLECLPLPFDKNLENIDNFLRQYVSLIPILKSDTDCLGLNGVWLSNQTILDTTWASPKDQGVLLACYYMSLGIQCWLVLGMAYPYGETVYVLTQEQNNYILTDSSTGKRYNSKNVQCPLNSIHCLVSQNNIYCNLQKEERVSMTDFNLNDNSLWLSLFNKNNPAPIGGFHTLNFKYNKSYSVFELRKNIERKIIKKISSWRSNRKTVWNRAYTDMMYDILLKLEEDKMSETISNNYTELLGKEIANYKVYGFTLNFPYINLTSISKKIRSTGIHSNIDKDVEYALSVHIMSYPNNIFSCWIFLLTLTPFA